MGGKVRQKLQKQRQDLSDNCESYAMKLKKERHYQNQRLKPDNAHLLHLKEVVKREIF